jgi:hypothetical protein
MHITLKHHAVRERVVYQCYVRQRAQGKYRDLSRKLWDLINQGLISPLLNFLDTWIRKLYVPKTIWSMNEVGNMRLSSLFTVQNDFSDREQSEENFTYYNRVSSFQWFLNQVLDKEQYNYQHVQNSHIIPWVSNCFQGMFDQNAEQVVWL